MLYRVELREVRIVNRVVQVHAAGRSEARVSALDPDKWEAESELRQDLDDAELDSVTVTSIKRLWQHGEQAGDVGD